GITLGLVIVEIPEQHHVAAMGHDVIGLRRRRRPSLEEALAHDGYLSTWAHATQRIPETEPLGVAVPAFGVATLVRTESRLTWIHRSCRAPSPCAATACAWRQGSAPVAARTVRDSCGRAPRRRSP